MFSNFLEQMMQKLWYHCTTVGDEQPRWLMYNHYSSIGMFGMLICTNCPYKLLRRLTTHDGCQQIVLIAMFVDHYVRVRSMQVGWCTTMLGRD